MSSYTEGQIHQLAERLQAEGYTPDHLRRLGQNEKNILTSVLGVLSGTHEIIKSAKQAEVRALLVSQGTTTLTLTEEHHPGRFYKTRRGLWVSTVFLHRVVARAKKSAAGKSFNLQHATLARDATDQEIEAELPGTHLFDETDVCAVIEGLIAKQQNGEAGTLLNNGYANLFYTSSCVVGVYWHADDRRWVVSAWRRNDHRWRAHLQVFSPATGT